VISGTQLSFHSNTTVDQHRRLDLRLWTIDDRAMEGSRLRRRVLITFSALAAGYLVVLIFAWFAQRQVVWPMSVEEAVDRPVPPGAEVVWLPIPGGRVEGWFFPAQGASAKRPAPAVMFFHGNNEVLDHCLEYAETYPLWGLSLLLVEYRGYGRSGGSPSLAAVRSDMIRFFDHLVERPEVTPRRIVFHGRSIGGGVAADLAAHRTPAAMILAATFTNLESMFRRYGIPGILVRDRYDTVAALETMDVPVLVLHGERDNIIPVAQGRRLGRSGPRTTYVELDCNHDLPADWPSFERTIRGFLCREGFLTAAPPTLQPEASPS
jgi:fermentation-respiration switch protein FrsA (DUF1100 family)